MPVATFLGHVISLPDVYGFAINVLIPTIFGFVSSILVKYGKQNWIIHPDPAARLWVIRLTVAILCLALNLATIVLAHGQISIAILTHSFVSYLAAITTYEHSKDPTQN